MWPEVCQIQFLISSLNSFHSQDQKLGDWCWVMKSTSSAMPLSLTLRRISSAEWHKKSPGKTSYTCMCQLETSTDQRYIPVRYSSPKERAHDLTKSLQFRYASNRWEKHGIHIYPRSGSWRPMRVCHHPKMGGMKNTQKTWDNGYKKPGDRWRKGQKNWE